MHVVLVTHVAPPHVGGVEQVVQLEALGLADSGCSVEWITSDRGGAGEEVPAHDDLRVVRIRAWHILERLCGISYPLFAPTLIFRLWRAVGRADAVHVHGMIFGGSVTAALIARMRGTRCILTDHGGILRYKSRIATFALRAMIETGGRLTALCAHRCLAINADLHALLSRLGGAHKVDFVPNPVDGVLFAPSTPESRAAARAALGWDEKPRVLAVGRLLPHKGAQLLLERRDAPYRVAWCGPGEPDAIQALRDAGGDYYAPRPQAELVQLYHAADAFALPSKNEGFPLAVQEALACGLPAVTSDAPAYAPYRDLPGLYLCARNPAAVHTAIERALEGPRPTRSALAASSLELNHSAWARSLLAEASAG